MKAHLLLIIISLMGPSLTHANPNFVLSYWTHGGEPGSESSELKIEKTASGATAVLKESGMDFASESARPFTRNYKLDLNTQEFFELTALLKNSPLSRQREKKGAANADLRQEQWTFETEGRSVKESFSEPFPASFGELRNACQKLITKMKKQ